MREIADVEHAHTTHALRADLLLHALRAAIDPPVLRLSRKEEQVLLYRHVVLLLGAELGVNEPRVGWVRDVPHLEAAEVTLEGVLTSECHVRVHVVEIAWLGRDEFLRWRTRRH